MLYEFALFIRLLKLGGLNACVRGEGSVRSAPR